MLHAPADLVAPSFEWCPPSVGTDGPDAVALAGAAGLFLDPWQAYALDRILATDEHGLPAAFECALIVPRQNGKGSLLEALSLYWLFAEQAQLVLHSAHQFKTASEAFRRIQALLSAPDLAPEVGRVLTGAGSEAVELVSGPRLRFVARSAGSGRGFTAAKIILDEAYAVDDQEMAALLPTLATQRGAQIVYTSSAGMATSEYLRRVRDRGRGGGDPALCYLEWGGTATCPRRCAHDPQDPLCQLNDQDLWRAANPGIPHRLGVGFVAKERRALSPESFARERLGVWDEPESGAETIPVKAWLSRVDPGSAIVGGRVLALDVAPDRRTAAIAGAGRRVDGATHGALVEHAAGTAWVVPRLLELIERHRPLSVVLDGASPAAALLPELLAAGLTVRSETNPRGELVVMSARDMGAACGGLFDAVAGDAPSLWHRGDPILTAALAGAARRDVGDGGWAFARKRSDADICPLVAFAEAVWGLSTAPAEPEYEIAQSIY